MALDTKMIGFWDTTEVPDERYYEISPSGKYFIHDIPYRYEISFDGLTLTFYYPDETALFQRVDTASLSLIGTWSRMTEGGKETCTYNPDGSFLGNWNDTDFFFGFYQNFGDKVKQINFRGNISTEGNVFTLATSECSFSLIYAFEGNDVFYLYKAGTTIPDTSYYRKWD